MTPDNAAIPLAALNQDVDGAQRLADEQAAPAAAEALPEGFGQPHKDAVDTKPEGVPDPKEAAADVHDTDTAAAAAVEDADDDPANAGEPAAQAARKDDVIPPQRLAEVVAERNRLRDRAEAAEAEAARLRELQAQAPVTRNFDKELSTLEGEYDDGEIEMKEYLERRDGLVAERTNAQASANEAARTAERDKAAIEANWNASLEAFLATPAHSVYNADDIRAAALNAALQVVYAEQPTATFAEILAAAHGKVEASYGKTQDPRERVLTERRAAAAVAAAATSTLPARPQGGVGNRSGEATTVDMDAMTPERWAKMPQAERDKALGITPAGE